MKAITKLEIINALGETTSTLSLRKKDLLEKLFEVQYAAEKEIINLKQHGLIDVSEWGVTFLERKYNNYMMYDGCIIDQDGGRYDGGDFNEWVPATDYKKLVEFCEKSTDIIKGMQDALSEELDKIELIASK